MQANIRDEILGMERIQLKQEDFIGTGSFSNVYRYRIHNVVIAVQCFQDQAKAEEYNATLSELQRITINQPAIIQYYGMKKLEIEIIGTFSESNNGYALFFQQCQLDLQKMLGIVTKLQTKEIFNLLSQNINLQAFIIELIYSFNQLKPNVNSHFPCFKSDILKNFFYSTIILALFEEQNICLTRIHAQFNFKPGKFDTEAFHNDCDNKGSTLVIMHCNKEPNSFFGGMAAPSWNSKEDYIVDPADKCSWLFKIEVKKRMIHLHQWKCIKADEAIYGNEYFGPTFGDLYRERRGYYRYYGYGYRQGGYGYRYGGGGYSNLSSNNLNYEKINLNDKTTGLLFQLKNEINCPKQVKRKIMNEEMVCFHLDSCEVFAIKN